VCYARSRDSQIGYLEYIDEEYNSKRLENIVEDVTGIINAKLVSISTQDYDPRVQVSLALSTKRIPLHKRSKNPRSLTNGLSNN